MKGSLRTPFFFFFLFPIAALIAFSRNYCLRSTYSKGPIECLGFGHDNLIGRHGPKVGSLCRSRNRCMRCPGPGTIMAIRILIVDDSPIIRQCLGRLLKSHGGWEICGEASDGEDAVSKTQELVPDVIVMDFLMPRKNGLEAAREIGRVSPNIPILLCTICLTPQLVDLARSVGIAGMLSKGDLDKVFPCIETLLRGETFVLCRHQLSQHI